MGEEQSTRARIANLNDGKCVFHGRIPLICHSLHCLLGYNCVTAFLGFTDSIYPAHYTTAS